MEISGIKGYDILLRGDVKTLADYAYKENDLKITDMLKITKRTSYNGFIPHE